MKKASLLFLFLFMGSIFLLACSNNKKDEKNTNQETSSSIKASSKDSGTSDQDVQQIGNEEVGYVYVPDDWIRYSDFSLEPYQYSAPDDYTVVTMFGYDKETLDVETIDAAAVEQMTNSYIDRLEERVGYYGSIEMSKATISGYEAHQIYTVRKLDKKSVYTWVFVTEEKDKVYLISLEGQKDDESFLEAFSYIESTWSTKKD